jgi:hypothetical protein
MLADALRYPLGSPTGRDAVAVCTGLVLAVLLSLRLARALWPAPLAAVPGLFALIPAALFAGYLGGVLTADIPSASPPSPVSAATFRSGLRLLVVAAGYLLPAAVAVVLTALVLLRGGGGAVLTIAPTVALLATVASLYVLPAALAAGATGGLRAAFSRASLGGLASGSYFFAWTVAVALVVSAWSLLAAATTATPAAVVLVVVLAYVHVAAARLLAQGLARSPNSPWGRDGAG